MEDNPAKTSITSIVPPEGGSTHEHTEEIYAPLIKRQYELPSLAQKTISRRRFLVGVAATLGVVGAAAYFGIRPANPNSDERKSVSTIQAESLSSEAVGGDFLERFREEVCFNEEIARSWMEEENIPEEDFGKIAAAGVTFLSITNEGNQSYTSEGTGGVAEYKGKKYLVTTMHVIDSYLNEVATEDSSRNPMLIVNIPGTRHMYRVNPRSIASFIKLTDDSRDTSVFIEIEGDLSKEVDELIAEDKLSPLQPVSYNPNATPSLSQLRFQRGVMGIQEYSFHSRDNDANVDRYTLVDTTGKATLCSGNSGALALERNEGKLTGRFMGVFTHGTEYYSNEGNKLAFSSDSLGVMGDTPVCSVASYMTSFGERNMATGIKEVLLR